MEKTPDFGGYCTKNDVLCTDGRTIRKGAFAKDNYKKVPLLWNHKHDDPDCVLGHAILENREDGVYSYGYFNDTPKGISAKGAVKNGDITMLSVWANQLQHTPTKDVIHGCIKEVSLVLAGANAGAVIDSVMCHSEESVEDEATISYVSEYLDFFPEEFEHSEELEEKTDENSNADAEDAVVEHSETDDTKKKSVADIIDELTEEQKEVVMGLIGLAASGTIDDEIKNNEKNEGDDSMKQNAFDEETMDNQNYLSHTEMTEILDEAKKGKRISDVLKARGYETVMAHAQDSQGNTVTYGVADINYLFPDAKLTTTTPGFIKRDDSWVAKFKAATKHVPFSRIKSIFANITEDEARAKGYIKGKQKKDEVFTLLKRTTTPQTIYKKQKLDRDDIVDIKNFNIVAWLKSEMRMMLDEEIMRAALVGDNRPASSDDKISEDHIKPIWKDDKLYTIKHRIDFKTTDTADDKAKAFIRAAIKSRKEYKGSGSPTLYTTEDLLSDCLLLEDTTGRLLYTSEAALATALRVKEIVTVPVMEGLTRVGVQLVDGDTDTRDLMGIIVNPADYTFGADAGGAVSLFDDFDIDFNQEKYLIEARTSGALTIPYSAIAIESVTAD